jgi:hypothetical protein
MRPWEKANVVEAKNDRTHRKIRAGLLIIDEMRLCIDKRVLPE